MKIINRQFNLIINQVFSPFMNIPNEMNISGNMNQFWFNLVEVGNDVLEGDSFKTPLMKFENIDFSGI